jgi:hypothetical protein
VHAAIAAAVVGMVTVAWRSSHRPGPPSWFLPVQTVVDVMLHIVPHPPYVRRFLSTVLALLVRARVHVCAGWLPLCRSHISPAVTAFLSHTHLASLRSVPPACLCACTAHSDVVMGACSISAVDCCGRGAHRHTAADEALLVGACAPVAAQRSAAVPVLAAGPAGAYARTSAFVTLQ